MSNLSPAAQAVLDAFAADNYGVYLEGDLDRIAAALRAAVEQVLPHEQLPATWPEDKSRRCDLWLQAHQRQSSRADLLAIATELENP